MNLSVMGTKMRLYIYYIAISNDTSDSKIRKTVAGVTCCTTKLTLAKLFI